MMDEYHNLTSRYVVEFSSWGFSTLNGDIALIIEFKSI